MQGIYREYQGIFIKNIRPKKYQGVSAKSGEFA
jgi:hypothetical protein